MEVGNFSKAKSTKSNKHDLFVLSVIVFSKIFKLNELGDAKGWPFRCQLNWTIDRLPINKSAKDEDTGYN